MPTFDVLSGTWYHIEAPDPWVAQQVYDAHFSDEPLPKGCSIRQGEVDSYWEGISNPLPNETTYKAMQEAWNGETTPEPPSGWEKAW